MATNEQTPVGHIREAELRFQTNAETHAHVSHTVDILNMAVTEWAGEQMPEDHKQVALLAVMLHHYILQEKGVIPDEPS